MVKPPILGGGFIPRISRENSNCFPLPNGAIVKKNGTVYVNISSHWVPSSESGKSGYGDHEQLCIGVIRDKKDQSCKFFYGNDNYHRKYLGEFPEPPEFADSMAVGLTSWIREAAEKSGLTKSLTEVFKSENALRILDLAAYMLSQESAVMQHYPAWARDHVTLSDTIPSDTQIGRFLRDDLTVSKINQFKEKWAVANIGNGYVFFCYDSTNVNSQAKGVLLVEMGHAKDDPTMPQVNTDYVVRQKDGLPLTYMHSPGSIVDIAQAQEMLSFMSKIVDLSGKKVQICLVCDRGYISVKNVRLMDDADIDYLLMLRSDLKLYKELCDPVIDGIKSYKNRLESPHGDEIYGITRECKVYDVGPTCYGHVFWSAARYRAGRVDVDKQLKKERKELDALIASSQGKSFTEDELPKIPEHFRLITTPDVPRQVEKKKRGRGGGSILVDVPTVSIIGYEDDEDAINRLYMKAGIFILISRKIMTVQEALIAYSKRDCVEKAFEALKSHLGMDKIGVTTEEAMHGKGLIWFVASILHALLFNGTDSLRIKSKKQYTIPAMVDHLEAIKADKDLNTGKYGRRYKVTKYQSDILKQWKIGEKELDAMIADLAP